MFSIFTRGHKLQGSQVSGMPFEGVLWMSLSFCWPGHIYSSLWSNVSKVTSLLLYISLSPLYEYIRSNSWTGRHLPLKGLLMCLTMQKLKAITLVPQEKNAQQHCSSWIGSVPQCNGFLVAAPSLMWTNDLCLTWRTGGAILINTTADREMEKREQDCLKTKKQTRTFRDVGTYARTSCFLALSCMNYIHELDRVAWVLWVAFTCSDTAVVILSDCCDSVSKGLVKRQNFKWWPMIFYFFFFL